MYDKIHYNKRKKERKKERLTKQIYNLFEGGDKFNCIMFWEVEQSILLLGKENKQQITDLNPSRKTFRINIEDFNFFLSRIDKDIN